MRLSLLCLSALLVLPACATRYAVRDSTTYATEVAATVARQDEAADALFVAAERAKEAGDWRACAEYAGPALLIEASAQVQANRALWLADLPYPDPETGEAPPVGTEQPDPGKSPSPRSVVDVCGPAPAEEQE